MKFDCPPNECVIDGCARPRIKGHRVCWHCKRHKRASKLISPCAGKGCKYKSLPGRTLCAMCFNRRQDEQQNHIDIPCIDDCGRMAAPRLHRTMTGGRNAVYRTNVANMPMGRR